MTALTTDRATSRRAGGRVADPLAVAAIIFAGGFYVLDAQGNATAATAAATSPVRGVAIARASTAAGDTHVEGELGVFRFDNSAGAAEIKRTDIDANAFVADDQTVAKTGTSIAGVVVDVDEAGVWVRVGTQAPAGE